ncbi:SGNH/GDSL hydrolase family protein [Nocardiopsis mangrovi]|uniref:SGNH/GDSL hydrolase family protein n=1 Tax=Nocardiopsis mangrovi TaxID=1179818 RepID=A0ABV9DZZ1_9ACTN
MPASPRHALRSLAAPAALCAALTGVLAAPAPASAAPTTPAPAPAAAEATRIMPLGDSITGSPGCWRALLWNDLQEAGRTSIDFVGTQGPQGCGVDHDGDNEGHPGLLATNVARQGLLVGWLQATDPDVVLMHFGTNDVWSSVPTATILDAYSTLVGQMRAANPDMRIAVAQIIRMDSARSCATCAQSVANLNAAIPAWAAEQSTDRSPVVVADQWTGFDTDTDTYDGVHPNAAGDRKIADTWLPVIDGLLDTAA